MKYFVVSIAPFNQNCLLVWCEKTNEAAVIDPGGETTKICRKIDILKLNIKNIFLTHGHVDHVGGAMQLKQYYNVPILGPNKMDKFLLDNLYFQYCMLGLNKFTTVEIVNPDVWLEDHNRVKIGCEVFEILHCPGHSPGHIVFWNKACKFIAMGDVLFKGNIGRADLPGGNFDILIHSIKSKLLILDKNITFMPGHGLGSTIGHEYLNNPYLK